MSDPVNASHDMHNLIHTVNLAIYIVIVSVGCIWNGILLFMFARHKEIQTSANIMIFSLAVCDFVNVLVVAPLRYQYHYPHSSPDDIDFCRFVSAFHHCILSADALSIVALSIQKFCVTLPNLIFQTSFSTRKKYLITTVYIMLVWLVSLLISLPYAVNENIYGYLCGTLDYKLGDRIMILANFVLFCVLLPIVVFSMNFATARRLKRSDAMLAGRINNSIPETARKRSANVVMVLSVFFLLSHVPYFIWNIYAYWTDINRHTPVSLILEYFSKHLLFLNSCFNPLALFMTSSTFRRLFKKYLCCLKDHKQIHSNIQFNYYSSTAQR